MRRYVYVTCWGSVWRLSKRQWIRFLKDFVARPCEPDLKDYGKMLAGDIHNVTDLEAEEAQDLLEDVTGRNRTFDSPMSDPYS